MTIQRSVATICSALALLCADPASAAELDANQQLARELLRELVEIDTSGSAGTLLAARALATRLRAAGFPEQDVRVIESGPSKGNLVARLRGRGAKLKPLLLLGHLDVVPADPKDWSVAPFQLLERDGYYWGRGTTDDKDECAIHVANLIRLKREGFVPERDIVVALTADEEGGEHNGVRYLIANHRELIDAELALNEGGGGALKNGKRLSNQVQASEKTYQSYSLEVTDDGGHSSLPRPGNPIYVLSDALLRVREHRFPVKLNEITRGFFERSATQEPPEIASAMRAVLKSPPDTAAVAKLSAIPVYNARLRTTCVATRLEAGHAENALPQRARAVINCRILPGETPEEIEVTLRKVVADPRVELRRIGDETLSSPPSPLLPEVMREIERTTSELWPGVPVVPTMMTGASDGLFLRNAGIPVFGVSGIFADVDDIRAHGKDERVSITAFFDGQEFLYRLTKRLASPGAGDAATAR